MNKLNKLMGSGMALYSLISAAGDTNIVLTKGMSSTISDSNKYVTIISENGIPVKLSTEDIRNKIVAKVGSRPISELELQIHDEENEIIITDRTRIIIKTDLRELRTCCINGVGPDHGRYSQ